MNEKQTEKAEAIADDLREHGIYPKGSIRDWIERFHKISPIIGDTYDCESESKIMSLITQLLAEQNDKLNKYCEKKINQAYADAQDGADEATHKAMDEELEAQKRGSKSLTS